MTVRYLTIPPDATIYNPNTNEPVYNEVAPPEGSPPDTKPTRVLSTLSWNEFIRTCISFMLRTTTTALALVDLRNVLTGPIGADYKPGQIIAQDDADPIFAALCEVTQNPGSIWGPNTAACCAVSYEPFYRVLFDSPRTRPQPALVAAPAPVDPPTP